MNRRSGMGNVSFLRLAPLSHELELADASIAESFDSTMIDHFLFVPPHGIREAQLRLAAWGRPLMSPAPAGDVYGWVGPLAPADFADMNHADDLDGVDSHRTGLAIGSFQRWWNVANAAAGQPLREDGRYDQATHAALVSVTGVELPGATSSWHPNLPSTQLPKGTDATSVPTFGIPGVSGDSDTSETSPLPGSAQGGGAPAPWMPGGAASGSTTEKKSNWIAYALIAAGLALGIYVIVAVVRRKRRRA